MVSSWLLLACLLCVASASVINFPHSRKNVKEWERTQEKLRQDLARADEEDAHLNFIELATKYGYPVEEHSIETEDGHILTVHRIPHGKDGRARKYRGVVFVQHGLLSSSIDWIIPGPDKGIAYLLADRGYDVWVGNARGNTYCKKHTNPSIAEKDFWDFSWHEIGTIDLPAMIDFALATTGEEKLHYIGHSQGTTAFFVMASEKPEYNAKIRAQYSLAPIAYMNHMTSPLFQVLALAEGVFEPLFKFIGMYEFLPTDGWLHDIAKFFCNDGILQPLCTNALFVACGFNEKQMNATLLPIMMAHTPAGSATKQILHYAQLINTGGLLSKGKFRQYDYGYFENKNRYGQGSPPDYDLSKITAPVYLFYSKNDWLAAEVDVRRLYDELGNAQGKFLNPDSWFNHLDYIFGIDADTLVYDKVLSTMLRH